MKGMVFVVEAVHVIDQLLVSLISRRAIQEAQVRGVLAQLDVEAASLHCCSGVVA